MSAVRRSLWLSLADSYLGLVLRLASTMIISRILTPDEVGVLAVSAVFISLASMFRDFGVAEYMIQEKDLTREKIAATLALNIIVSWAMALLIFGGSSLVADFYKNPGIGEVMRVQAACFLLVPFGAVTMAYFRRELNFRPVLIVNIISGIIGFIVSVVLVLLGFGYMSLAWSMLVGMIASVAGSIWYRPKDFPRWPSFKGIVEVFHFSKFASSVYLLGQVGKGAPEMIIGRVQGMHDVAIFSRGGGLIEMFQRLVMRPVMFVCMPYFAQSDRQLGSIAHAYIKSVSYLTVVGWPCLAFMGVAAFSAMRVVYGPQWDAAVPIAQILVAAFALELIHSMSREALLAGGHARIANAVQVWMVILKAVGLLAVVPWGVSGAAYGMLASSFLGVVVAQIYLQRHLGIETLSLLTACGSSLLVTLLSLAPAVTWAVISGVTSQNYITFGIGGGVITALSWFCSLYALNHPFSIEAKRIFKKLTTKLFPSLKTRG